MFTKLFIFSILLDINTIFSYQSTAEVVSTTPLPSHKIFNYCSDFIEKQVNYVKNCRELKDRGINDSGIYTLQPDFSPKPFLVFCDMSTKNGGWIIFLNRLDGSQNFSVPWKQYKSGFGNLAGEFWLGLEYIYQLTRYQVNELLIELIDWDLEKYQIYYESFSIGSEDEDYYLKVIGKHNGDLRDSLTYHAGQKFSTVDRRNDNDPKRICTEFVGGGGWWHHECRLSLLTGLYLKEWEAKKGKNHRGIYWSGMQYVNPVPFYSFKEARMMIRPKNDLSLA